MIDTGKATIKTYGRLDDNILLIDIYFGGELTNNDIKDIYHVLIKKYDVPVNILCTRNKDNVYSSDAADYIKINARHVFNKIACIADEAVTIESFNSSQDTLFKFNKTKLFDSMDEGYHWLKNT
jgi:hypothetical protein